MAQPNNPLIYRHVKSYQFLQRQWNTNTAWVEDDDGQCHELEVGGPWTVGQAHHLVVGDLWVLAGQSNMRGYGFFVDTKRDSCIPVFQSDETWGRISPTRPIHQLASSPRVIHHTLPDPTVRKPSLAFERGASVAPAFAERYSQQLGVPVGFVPCAHGGVTIDEWSKQDDDALYGVMMDKIRLVGGQLTGILWYQGESDAVDLTLSQRYQDAWTRWLDQLGQDLKNTLVVYGQIGRMVTEDDHDLGWNLVRKAQLDVYQKQKQQQRKIAMVSTLDADMDDFIHLSAKGLDKVGYRLADAAVALIQQDEPPVLYATHLELLHLPYNHDENAIHILRLDLINSKRQPLICIDNDRPITGFTIHDTHQGTQLDIIYSVRINQEQKIDLYLTEKGYRYLTSSNDGRYVLWYGYGRNPQCNLVTTNNVAAVAFGPLPIVC